MPEIYYQVIALAMRYVFAGICFLIVLRTFYWQRVEHRAWKQRVRQLPDTGYIGEFYAVRGTSAFPAGTCVAVPWEGTMGSSVTADITVQAQHIARKHLFFFFDPASGLVVEVNRHQRCVIDGHPIDDRTAIGRFPMHHGSVLEVGDIVLRLRLFSGMESEPGHGRIRKRNTKQQKRKYQASGIGVPKPGKSASSNSASRRRRQESASAKETAHEKRTEK